MTETTEVRSRAAAPASARPRSILLAFDGTDASALALELAVDLATATGARVGIISVVPIRLGPPADDPWSGRSEAAARLQEARSTFARRAIDATLHEPSGDAGPLIVRVASEFEYDLIVLGSRNLDPVRRALLGSVSTFVVRHADVSVLVAR